MTVKSLVSRVVTAALLVVVVALLLSGALGRPILLGYVETGSMSPTLRPGDGFVAIPAAVAGPVHEGDVITFRAEVLHGGDLTTHRVVAKTDHGYITKGDANPVTDQSGAGEPPVREEQVVAKALQIRGHVVVVPQFRRLVSGSQAVVEYVQLRVAGLVGSRALLGTQGFATLFAVCMLGLYGADVLREALGGGRSKARERSSKRETGLNARVLLLGLTLVLVIAMTLGMAVPSGYHEYRTIQSDTEVATLHVSNSAFVPMVVLLEPASQKIEASPARVTVDARSTKNVTVRIAPPHGRHDRRRYLGEHRYFTLLPQGAFRSLYRIHPWSPVFAIDALVAIPFYLLGVRVVGTGRIRDRSRNLDYSIVARCRRAFRKLY